MTNMNFELLNDLRQINIDRIEGYERAIATLNDAEDEDLKTLFPTYVATSNAFIRELTEELKKIDRPIATGGTTMGKNYRGWSEIKAFFSGNERQTILNSCEAIEDAAKNAYESALNQPGLTGELFVLIDHQANELKKSHYQVKKMRDA